MSCFYLNYLSKSITNYWWRSVLNCMKVVQATFTAFFDKILAKIFTDYYLFRRNFKIICGKYFLCEIYSTSVILTPSWYTGFNSTSYFYDNMTFFLVFFVNYVNWNRKYFLRSFVALLGIKGLWHLLIVSLRLDLILLSK